MLSQEVDIPFEKKAKDGQKLKKIIKQLNEEMDFIGVNEPNKTTSTTKSRDSGLLGSRKILVDKNCQVNIKTNADIRLNRNSSEVMKDTIASVSVEGAVSVEKARKITQTCLNKFEGYNFLLEP